MRLTDEMRADVAARVEEDVGALGPVHRRALLAAAITSYAKAVQRVAPGDAAATPEVHAPAHLYIEVLRDAVYPGIDLKRWQRLGWSNVTAGRTQVDRFFAKVDAFLDA